MTAKDIILDLEDCINLNRKPEKELLENTIGLIKHLQATNEMFTDIGKLYSEIKAEAYKEFAERLKESAFTVNQFEEVLYKEDIDNLLKEMVGADNG